MIIYEFLKEVLEGLNMTYRSNEKRWQALISKAMSMPEVRRANLQDVSLAAVRPGNQRTTSAYSGKKKKEKRIERKMAIV